GEVILHHIDRLLSGADDLDWWLDESRYNVSEARDDHDATYRRGWNGAMALVRAHFGYSRQDGETGSHSRVVAAGPGAASGAEDLAGSSPAPDTVWCNHCDAWVDGRCQPVLAGLSELATAPVTVGERRKG